MTYQILTCPNCGGKGCVTCQNTGKVRVSTEQLQKIKMLTQQLNRMPQSASASLTNPPAGGEVGPSSSRASLSGIIAWSILSILAGAAAASWYFLKSFKPFFFGLTTLLTLIGTRFVWKSSFFQLPEPDDFLKAIKK